MIGDRSEPVGSGRLVLWPLRAQPVCAGSNRTVKPSALAWRAIRRIARSGLIWRPKSTNCCGLGPKTVRPCRRGYPLSCETLWNMPASCRRAPIRASLTTAIEFNKKHGLYLGVYGFASIEIPETNRRDDSTRPSRLRQRG